MLVVTGPLRSGTSPVARMAHQMGILMGTSMGMPRPGTDELEFEDYGLSYALVRHIAGHDVIGDTRQFFAHYIAGRVEHFNQMLELYGHDKIRGWGVKTPYLMPFFAQWRSVAKGLGHEMRVVLCEREPIDTYRSLDKSQPPRGSIEPIYHVQDELYESLPAWGEAADMKVSLKETRANPGGVARQVAHLMGFDLEDDARTFAVHGIRRRR